MGVSDFNFLRILIVSIKSVNPKAKASILCYNFQKKVCQTKLKQFLISVCHQTILSLYSLCHGNLKESPVHHTKMWICSKRRRQLTCCTVLRTHTSSMLPTHTHTLDPPLPLLIGEYSDWILAPVSLRPFTAQSSTAWKKCFSVQPSREEGNMFLQMFQTAGSGWGGGHI